MAETNDAPTLYNYNATLPGGYKTVLRLTPSAAEKRGLSDKDRVTVTNKARSTTSGGGGGDKPAIGPDTTSLAGYKLADVTGYLETADEAERARIIELEKGATRPRAGIVDWQPSTPPPGE